MPTKPRQPTPAARRAMVSIHEASHSVVGELVGWAPSLARLAAVGDWGSVEIVRVPSSPVPAALGEAAMLLAGLVGESRFCTARSIRRPLSYSNDVARARIALAPPGADPGDLLLEVQGWALKALAAHWRAVEQIAVELLRSGCAFRPEIEAAVAAPSVEPGAVDRWIAEQDLAAMTADIRSDPRRWRRALDI